MNYQESLDWIHHRLKFGIKPGVKRMVWMLEQLGNPQDQVKGIHVVGTNGKGSTVAYLQEILTGSGYHVGTFTSPYIMDFRERISLDGQIISQADLVTLVQLVKPISERLVEETELGPATEFEIITLMMYLYFGQLHPVDVAIIEAGLGGLHDSTNVFTPLLVLCPSIGLDHQNILGETYAEIAAQKAGVMKPGVPFIYASDRADVTQVFETEAAKLSAPTYALGRDFDVLDAGAGQFAVQLPGGQTVGDLQLGMLGQHQQRNAALVVMACQILAQPFPKISEASLRQGLRRTHWQGRTEMIRPNLMLDGAHNQEGVAALVTLLKAQFADKPISVLFAAIEGKPVDGMLEQLSVFDLTVTSFDDPRALTLSAYPDGIKQVAHFSDWLPAQDVDSETLYVVTGSLYFISAVRTHLLASN